MDMLLSAVLEDAIDDLMDDVIDSGEVEIIEDEEDGIFAHPQMEEEPEDVYEDPYIQDQYSDEEDEGEDNADEYVEYPVDATESDSDLDAIIDQLDSQIDGEDDDSDDEDDIFVDESATLKSEGSLYTLEDSVTSFEEYERFVNESFLLNNTIYIGEEYIKEDGIFKTIIEKVKKIIEWLWDKIISLVDMIKTKILEFVTGQSRLTQLVEKFRAAKINPDDIPDQIAEESAILEEKMADVLTGGMYHIKVGAVERARAASCIDTALNFNVNTLLDSTSTVNTLKTTENFKLAIRELVKIGCGFTKEIKLNFENVDVGYKVDYKVAANESTSNNIGINTFSKKYLTEANNDQGKNGGKQGKKNNPQNNQNKPKYTVTPVTAGEQKSTTIESVIFNNWFKPQNEVVEPFKVMLASKNEICDQYVALMRFIRDVFKEDSKKFKSKKEEYSKAIKKYEKDIKDVSKTGVSLFNRNDSETAIPDQYSDDVTATQDYIHDANETYFKLQILREAANIHTFIIECELNAINRCILTEYKYVRNTLVDLMTFSGFGAKTNIKINSLILRDTPVGASTRMDPMDVNYTLMPRISRKG